MRPRAEGWFVALVALVALVAAANGCDRFHTLGAAAKADAATGNPKTDAGDAKELGSDRTDTASDKPDAAGLAGATGAAGAPDASGTSGVAGMGGGGAAGMGSAGGGGAGGGPPSTCVPAPARPCLLSCDLAYLDCVDGVCIGDGSVRRWLTLGGDNRHSGWARNEKGGPPAQRAWRVQVHKGVQPNVWPVVADDDTVYVVGEHVGRSLDSPLSSFDQVWALAASDGHARWSADFSVKPWAPTSIVLGMPTLADGFLYFTQGSTADAFNILAARTGRLVWSQEMKLAHHWAPLVVGRQVYLQRQGLMALGLDQCTITFDNPNVEPADQWSPLYHDGAIFTFVLGELRRFDRETGDSTPVARVPTTVPASQLGAPISDGTKIYAVEYPALYAFRSTESKPAWSVKAAYAGMPAIADNVVYALSDHKLHAHDADTGTESWTFDGDGALQFPPVVAARWVYVSSPDNVYAVDTTTHLKVWEATPGGWLSIAAGQLLVAQPDGFVSAYPLSMP